MTILDIPRSREQWASDFSSIINSSTALGTDLYNLLRNLACHYIFEQHADDRNRDTFEVPIPPLGVVTLKHNENNTWSLIKVDFSQSFVLCANETLRCHESNLYRDQSEATTRNIKRRLQQFREDRL